MLLYIKALLLAYTLSTGQPSYTLLSNHIGKDTSRCWLQPQHRVQWGDLNCDGIVDSKDLWLYFDATGQVLGWTINGDIAHPDPTCYALQRSTKPKTLQPCTRHCLPCTARRLSE